MKKLLFTFLVVLCGTVFTMAANVEGKWKASMGEFEITYVFATVDGTLTGNVETPMGDMPLSNVVVEDNTISFEMDMMGNTMKSSGTFDDKEMRIKSTGGMQGGDQEMVFTKLEE